MSTFVIFSIAHLDQVTVYFCLSLSSMDLFLFYYTDLRRFARLPPLCIAFVEKPCLAF